jgi:5-methylcytosine-specific restriction endonuclease McrA
MNALNMNKPDLSALICDRIFEYLHEYSQLHPGFTFDMRSRNSVQSKIDRFEKGIWFQGDGDYLFISTYKCNDSENHTRSIGFSILVGKQLEDCKCYLTVVYGGQKDPTLIRFHEEVRETLGVSDKISGEQKYRRQYHENDIMKNLKLFIEHDRKVIDGLISKNNLDSRFFIEKKKFETNLNRILRYREIRTDIGSRDEDSAYLEGERRRKMRWHTWCERNPKLVIDYKNLRKGTTACDACGEDMAKKYQIDLLEVHHIVPLSSENRPKITKLSDLALLCPSCHRAIHKIMARNDNQIIDIHRFQMNYILKTS